MERDLLDYKQELDKRVAAAGKSSVHAVVLRYLQRHGGRLFGHPARRDEDGRVLAVVERTNNALEHFFGGRKQELLAQSSLLDSSPRVLFYRTHAGAEVDILLEVRGRLVPIEIKHTSWIDPYDLRGLSSFLEIFAAKAPFGLVLCRTDQPVRLTEKIVAWPAARTV